MLRRPTAIMAGAFLAMAVLSTAFAQESDPVAELSADLDRAWLMLAAFLVFFMQAGFAMVEAGFVRSKNTTNILMKNVLDCCIGSIAFFLVGWAFAYGVSDSTNGFIGLGNFALNDFSDYSSWIFQFAFAATAATIVSGAMAERTKFGAYLFYSVFISAIIYPVVVHWAWSGDGWLTAFKDNPIGGNGYIDFAGSGVVHMVGGIAGLMGAIAVGPRIGKFSSKGTVNAIPGHNIHCHPRHVHPLVRLVRVQPGFNPGAERRHLRIGRARGCDHDPCRRHRWCGGRHLHQAHHRHL
jgi:Amt family ammonium transporter